MSEGAWKQNFDRNFFGAWGAAMGGLSATYTPPGGVAVSVDVLKEVNVEQFGDDGSPIAFHAVVLKFRREQIEPASRAQVVVDGVTYTLAQHIGGDESLSHWAVRA